MYKIFFDILHTKRFERIRFSRSAGVMRRRGPGDFFFAARPLSPFFLLPPFFFSSFLFFLYIHRH